MVDSANIEAKAATMSTSPPEDAATRGNFTLDDYLQMVDAAPSARPARGGTSGDDDGASIETNKSAVSADDSRTSTSGEAKKKKEAADIDIEPVPTLEGMGIDQLLDVLAFLPLTDRVRVHTTCRHLLSQQEVGDAAIRTLCLDKHGVGKRLIAGRVEEATRVAFNKRPALSTAHQRHALDSIQQSRELQWSRLGNLRELNIGKHCTDQFLAMISGMANGGTGSNNGSRGDMMMPELQRLGISGSCHVVEDALLNLTTSDGSGSFRTNLREIDVTFCSNITYRTVVQFRTLLPDCLLRRLPDWMCGHSETPFGGNGHDEVHTYWPDGAFSYNREEQSKGFVMRVDMLGLDPNHVSEKLQFIDFGERHNWFGHIFRPSVSLLRLENDEGTSGDTQHVLVAQRKDGMKRLKFFPKIEQAQIVPLGLSKHFDYKGNCLNEEVVDSQERTFPVAMVSHMRKKILQKEEHFPPSELVGEIASYLQEMKRSEEILLERWELVRMEDAEDLVDQDLRPDGVIPESESDYRYDDNMVAIPLI